MSGNSDFSLFDFLSWYLIFLFSLVAHEAAHAYMAWKLGDPTAHRGGQVTLDPTPHIRREPLGMVVVPLLSYFSYGWMIGWASAPYDRQWAAENPRSEAWMALAGPAANLAILFAALLLMKAGLALGAFTQPFHWTTQSMVVATAPGWPYFAARLLSIAFSLNLILFVFNLIPLPPLDGSSILKLFLPDSLSRAYSNLISNRIFAIAGIFAAWYFFSRFATGLMRYGYALIY